MTASPLTVVTFDLDGTLRNNAHRRHLLPSLNPESSWSQYAQACGDDQPIAGAVKLLSLLLQVVDEVHLISCADHSSYDQAAEWLYRHGIEYDRLELTNHEALGFPSDVDRKTGYIEQLHAHGKRVVLHVDNYAPVKRAVEAMGVPGLLVDPDYPPLGPDGLPLEA